MRPGAFFPRDLKPPPNTGKFEPGCGKIWGEVLREDPLKNGGA